MSTEVGKLNSSVQFYFVLSMVRHCPRKMCAAPGAYMKPGAFTICQQKPKIPVGNSNGTAHSAGKFLEKMEILIGIPLFPFPPK